jgi:hypothetical protein
MKLTIADSEFAPTYTSLERWLEESLGELGIQSGQAVVSGVFCAYTHSERFLG